MNDRKCWVFYYDDEDEGVVDAVSLSMLDCTGTAGAAGVACWSAVGELEAMEAAVASASPLISAALVS